MKYKTHIVTTVIASGFFLLLDQIIKFITRTNSDISYYLWKPWIGLEYFENSGIAFGIPMPQALIIFITPLVLLLLFLWWNKKKEKTHLFSLGTILIATGAISNFIDRVLYSFTIDYFRIFTSVINIADILIVCGALLIILCKQSHKK